ncbi:MAG: hypothetical protein WC533_00470 [Candidatus Pacearchaeota archaeon]
MKRGILFVLVLLFIVIFSFNFVLASNTTLSTEEQSLSKAYDCMKEKVGGDCSKLNLEETIYSALALGDYNDCKEQLISLSNNGECWPKTGCKLKETSLAFLALDRMGEDTDKISAWLLNQTKPASDLVWFLQIDSDSKTTCTIKYSGSSNSVVISADKKVSGNAGACLAVSSSGYWLQIASSPESCMEKLYTISCDKSFKTNLLYKTKSSSTIHVLENLHSAVEGGETEEQVNYKCFKQGSSCNYEGSLWATLVLDYNSEDTTAFVPYVNAFTDENEVLFPESFLYKITGDEDFLTSIINKFKGNYWDVGGAYSRYYSTALAFLSLQGQTPAEAETAKSYLLDGKRQNGDGCWNNIRDTGFLLYSGWTLVNHDSESEPEPDSECETDADCEDDEECTTAGFCEEIEEDCEEKGNYCLYTSECEDVEGVELPSFGGCLGFEVCCSKSLPTCIEKEGDLCLNTQECKGTLLAVSDDGDCCDEECVNKEEPEPEPENECETADGICRSSCNEDEKTTSDNCDLTSEICCVKKSTSSNWWIWIVVLLILIALAVIAIIFKDKIKMFLFKRKSKFKSGPVNSTRPGLFPPSSLSRAPPTNMFRRSPISQPVARQSSRQLPRSSQDKDFEETMKRLRDMSR